METEHYPCGYCNQPVITYWSEKGGLKHGDYCLLGEVFFHEGKCVDEYLNEFNLAIKAQ